MLCNNNVYHERLKAHPVFWSVVGVLHTLTCSGIVFGWASLLPVLRSEEGGVLSTLSATACTKIFTWAAVGNYLSNLPFGFLLDKCGPKACGIVASTLYAVGLCLCSQTRQQQHQTANAFTVGFALLGFAGPAIQLPTLHLVRLYPADEGGGGAAFMSAQAAAFDGGAAVFALFRLAAQRFRLHSSTFFLAYLLVPLMTLSTALFVWPSNILPDSAADGYSLTRSESFGGPGSPFLTPTITQQRQKRAPPMNTAPLKDAPLSTILSHLPFYALAIWVSIHILKLNFVVATINDQLAQVLLLQQQSTTGLNVDTDGEKNKIVVKRMIDLFGAMLPFGFVILPLVAYLLNKSPMTVFQLANVVGIFYGSVLALCPSNALLQTFVVFPAVATSRQMVYSTVFFSTGELFGFANYGVLLGLINVSVSLVSMIQNPLVAMSERLGSYSNANWLLDLATIPLFLLVLWTVPSSSSGKNNASAPRQPRETTCLLVNNEREINDNDNDNDNDDNNMRRTSSFA